MKTQVKPLNKFLLGLGKIVGYVSIAYLANFMVTEWFFGGVNPLLEFSSIGISKIDEDDSKIRDELGVAFEVCKKDLSDSSVVYQFPDTFYQAWNLDEGRFLIQSRVYTSEDSGSSVVANLMCRVLKTEDNEYLATHWTVQGIQVSML
ncbi:MAG: hypothetical protein ACRESZ_05520 [Methylococcales bacterium]